MRLHNYTLLNYNDEHPRPSWHFTMSVKLQRQKHNNNSYYLANRCWETKNMGRVFIHRPPVSSRSRAVATERMLALQLAHRAYTVLPSIDRMFVPAGCIRDYHWHCRTREQHSPFIKKKTSSAWLKRSTRDRHHQRSSFFIPAAAFPTLRPFCNFDTFVSGQFTVIFRPGLCPGHVLVI